MDLRAEQRKPDHQEQPAPRDPPRRCSAPPNKGITERESRSRPLFMDEGVDFIFVKDVPNRQEFCQTSTRS